MSELNEIELGQICRTAYDSYRATGFGLSNFPGLLRKIIRYKAWERRELVTEDGRPKGKVIELKCLRELITEKPPSGWGEDPKKIEAVIKDDAEALNMFRKAMLQDQGTRNDIHNNVMEVASQQGNSKAYTVSRLERESPELYQQVCNGELSANAAAIKAGIRKKPTKDAICVAAFAKAENRLDTLKAIGSTLDPHELAWVIDSFVSMLQNGLEADDE